MKRTAIVVIGLAILLASSLPAQAVVVVQGDGTATLTAGAGFVTVTLLDTAVNPVSIIQNISGITFTASGGGLVNPILVSPEAGVSYLTVAADGTPTTVSGPGIGAVWFYSGPASTYTLIWNGLPGTTGPAYTIIGAPDGSGDYSAANGSIAGNGPHNPFIDQTATFVLYIDGVTAETVFSDVTILFGTNPTVPPPPRVPEPGTLLLLGTGLVGLAALGRSKFMR